MKPFLLRSLCLLGIFILFSGKLSAQLTPIVDSILMSDGRNLAADIHIPSSMTSGPVVLIQTPYDRTNFQSWLPLGVGLNINTSNYIFVVVDWRGFHGSAAAGYMGSPTRGEDGYDCVEWIYAQSWCNGKIGTWGPSALGGVQFKTAQENPPHLTCICPLVAGPQFNYDEYFPGGVLRTEYVQQLDGLGFGISPILMTYPVYGPAWTFSENSTFYPTDIQVPCFMIGGWYDHNIEVMLDFFNGIRASSPVAVRNQHRLLMGPWVHGGHGAAYVGSSLQGQLSYPNATGWSDSLATIYFDYHLRNISNGWNTSQYVQYYQMGENNWNTSPTWPVSGTANHNFYFHDDGSLDNTIPTGTTDMMSYNYDPNDPSPTFGGPTLRLDMEQGPHDQSDTVESRNDVLVFSTIALPSNVVMKGSASVHMKVSSNKLDTDFAVRLTDVYPDGRSMLVNDGIFRMRFRDGLTAADTSVMVPNQIYDCVIDLPNTALTFLAGHKIRVDITSSNYPRFNRNMNTGEAMYPGTLPGCLDVLVNEVTASNTVYTNGLNTSYLTLPLVGFTAGVEEMEKDNVLIYPNPTTDFLHITLPDQERFDVNIYNTLGSKVYSGNIIGYAVVETENFAKGMYVIELRSEKKMLVRKFVKE